LTIALWVCNRRIANLDAKIFVVPLKCTTGELGPVVNDDAVWDPEPADYRLDEFDCRLFVDFDHRGRFRSLGKLVNGNVEKPTPSRGGRWAHNTRRGCPSRRERIEILFEVTTLHVVAPLTLALDGNATVFPIATAVKLSPKVNRCDARYRHTLSNQRTSSRWRTGR
jgi:hypothetical protein